MSSQRSQRTHKTRKGGATATNAKQIADPAVVKQDINQVFARVIGALKITVLVGATSLATVASRQALHPLYGSTASSYYFRHILAVSCLLSAASPLVPAHRLFLIQSVLLAVAPLSAKHLGIWFGRWGNAVWGAVLTQIPLTASFTALSCIIAKGWLKELLPPDSDIVLNRLPLGTIFLGVQAVEKYLWKEIPFGGVYTSCNMFLSLAVLASICAAATTPSVASKSKSKAPIFAFSAAVLSISLTLVAFSKAQSPCTSPHLPATFTSVYSPPTKNPLSDLFISWLSWTPSKSEPPRNVTVNLLARSDSVTGTIVVGEYVEGRYRFLRADHSLLGGRWISTQPGGAPLGDSVYGAFALQEAIRLVERDEKKGENTLVIGLGIGVVAEGLMRHGHKVHVVEIDPAVYAYARGFFNLDQPHAVHFVDARSWVREQLTLLRSTSTSTSASTDPGTQQPESSRFSMVVHDCFSGGGVPSHLFTLEFWEELKGTMTADGVVAVNFAGHVGSEASRAVWLTLQDAFSPEKGGRGCRAFHDAVDEKGGTPETVKKDEFLNVVFFCQKEEGRREGRSWVRFRNAREEDYLQSWLRRMVLSTLLEREIEPRQVTGVSDAEGSGKAWILTDYNYHSLDYWQRDTAVEHWSIMRQLMPHNVWEIY